MSMLSTRTAIAGLATMIVVVAVVLSLRTTGSPADARLRRLDERRVSDLEQLSFAIDVHWTREGQLPPALSALKPAGNDAVSTRDPERNVEYGYRILDPQRYELCADFSQRGGVSVWAHDAGRGCFTFDAKKVRQ